jgi:PIN domain nuclease of toxin-antitoxin system
VRLLLDTQVLLWWLADSPQLRAEAKRCIADPGNEVFVSAASVWEASIKRALGRVRFETDRLLTALGAGGLRPLPIEAGHALTASDLPRHHDDPFDRMLVAQAQLLGLTLVTHDAALKRYGLPFIWT